MQTLAKVFLSAAAGAELLAATAKRISRDSMRWPCLLAHS